MANKFILMANRQIPINCDAPVKLFADGAAPSFYNPAATLSQTDVQQMAMRRPNMKVYSSRRCLGNHWLNAEWNQLNSIPAEDFEHLRNNVWQVCIHHDVTLDALKTFSVLCNRGLSTHFCINHDGTLFQFMDVYHVAWATGDNNNHSIAVDMNNPVLLELAGMDPANPPRQVVKGKINGSMKMMLGYTDKQFATMIALLRALITPIKIGDAYWTPFPQLAARCFPPINESGQVIDRLLKDSINYVGFLGHYHCSSNKWDPGPAFDWLMVLAGIHGERNSFPVLLPEGRNLADLNGDALKQQLEAYYSLIEGNETGGWYPIGANQSWHSGVHLQVPEGSPVLALSKGTIVAVRNVARVDLGDPSFVLIKHEMQPDTAVPEGEEAEPVVWFSLYMHLRRMTNDELSGVDWVRALLGNIFEPPEEQDEYALLNEKIPRNKRPPKVADGTSPKFLIEAQGMPFFDGDIILTAIPVKAGEVIGYSGVFGSNEWNLEPQVHVECFSVSNIFEKKTGGRSDWFLVEGDLDDNSLVDISSVYEPIAKATGAKRSGTKYVIRTSEIQGFFVDGSQDTERQLFRKMICLHRSEWDPSLDWTKTATSAVGWQWETQEAFSRWLMTWVPFRWMTEEVLGHIKLPEQPMLYTYHPFHLLDQLNQSYVGATSATAEGASREEMNENEIQNRERLLRLGELTAKRGRGEELSFEEQTEYEELYALMDDHLDSGEADVGTDDYIFEYDGSFEKWEPGEWDPPKKDSDDYY
ncbi:MAG: N-acetylmuramoyl-L-alanine amidase [Myxococcota bacterium]|jgi:N-acetyl-anhydromuramyl-L-alanine amidase AmpD|nr:N-acetylmuramoyl-L-alanine amidase [Myxococcota bacterium]